MAMTAEQARQTLSDLAAKNPGVQPKYYGSADKTRYNQAMNTLGMGAADIAYRQSQADTESMRASIRGEAPSVATIRAEKGLTKPLNYPISSEGLTRVNIRTGERTQERAYGGGKSEPSWFATARPPIQTKAFHEPLAGPPTEETEIPYPHEFEGFLAQAGPSPDHPAYVLAERYGVEGFDVPVYMVDVTLPEGEGRELIKQRLGENAPEGYSFYEFQADTDPELERLYYPEGFEGEGIITGVSLKEVKVGAEETRKALDIEIEIPEKVIEIPRREVPFFEMATKGQPKPDIFSLYPSPEELGLGQPKDVTIASSMVGDVTYTESEWEYIASTPAGQFGIAAMKARDVAEAKTSPFREKMTELDKSIEASTSYFRMSGERAIEMQRGWLGVEKEAPATDLLGGIKRTGAEAVFGVETALFNFPEYLGKTLVRGGLVVAGVGGEAVGRKGSLEEVADITADYGTGLAAGTFEFGLAAAREPEVIPYTVAAIIGGAVFYGSLGRAAGIGKKQTTKTKSVYLSDKELKGANKWFDTHKAQIEASLKAKESAARSARVSGIMETGRMGQSSFIGDLKYGIESAYYKTKFKIQSDLKGGYQTDVYVGATKVAEGPGGMPIYQKVGFKTITPVVGGAVGTKAVSAYGSFAQTLQEPTPVRISTPTTTLQEGYFVPQGRVIEPKTTEKGSYVIRQREEMRKEAIELEKQQEAVIYDIKYPTKQALLEQYRQRQRYGERSIVSPRISEAMGISEAIGVRSGITERVIVTPRTNIGQIIGERIGTPTRVRTRTYQRQKTPTDILIPPVTLAGTDRIETGKKKKDKFKGTVRIGAPPDLTAALLGIKGKKVSKTALATGIGVRPFTKNWMKKSRSVF